MMTRCAIRIAVLLTLTGVLGTAAIVSRPAFAAERMSRRVKDDLRFAAEMAEKGLWREALYRWRRLLEQMPERAELHNNIAVALEALGEREDALAAYERAMELEPLSNIEYNRELARRAMELSQSPNDAGEAAEDASTAESRR